MYEYLLSVLYYFCRSLETMGERVYRSDRCLNPFERRHKLVSRRDLRKVSVAICQKLGIPEYRRDDIRLCSVCRKKVLSSVVPAPMQECVRELVQPSCSDSDVQPCCSVECDTIITELEKDDAILHLNETLTTTGESPLKKKEVFRHIIRKKNKKLQKIHKSLKDKVFEQEGDIGSKSWTI